MALQIGITGGIGSGKSLICKIFQHLGIITYDADSRAKYIMTTDGILVSQIKKEFGDLSYHPDGTLNRAHLAGLTFQDASKIKVLNQLVHPRVGEDYLQWLKAHASERYLIKEAALLFESGSYQSLDSVIVVSAPEEVRINRIVKRDPQRSMQQLHDIMKQQMPEADKLKRADYVIENDDAHLVIPQVLRLHSIFNNG